jgi:hypothetical protein
MIPAADDSVMTTLTVKMEIRQMVQMSSKFGTPLGHSDSSFKITQQNSILSLNIKFQAKGPSILRYDTVLLASRILTF